MVQQWRRSYFYFLSFAKQKGISCGPRKSSIFARVRKVQCPVAPRPDWDNTIHDLSAWRLTPKQLEARKTAFRTLPEHRVKRSCLSCNEQLTNLHTREHTARLSATSTAISSKPPTAETLKSVPHPKILKNRNRVRRFGKENKTSAVDETLQHLSKKNCHKKLTEEDLKTRSTQSARNFPNPFRTAVNLTSRSAECGGQSQILNQTIAQETESGGNQTLCSTPTVDFEDEVKQFEARTKKFLVQASKRAVATTLSAATSRAEENHNNCENYSKTSCRLLTLKLLRRKVMDKSDSSDDDSSLSGPWENSMTRFQKVMQSVPQHHQHHHHRKHYSRKLHEEGQPTAAHLSSKANGWDSQNELVHFKQPVNAASKPRTKLVKRHFGSIQRTSPIRDWKGNFEEGADDHLSLHQDFQQHMLKCQHDLTQEFKEFKISISKQIMNLQLDIDTVLELQKRKDSHSAETRDPSSFRTGAESPVQEGVGDNVELPTYSSMKANKDMINPASPSSGESSHMPLFSCYDSQYTGSRKSTRSVHGSENGGRRPSSATAAAEGAGPEPHVFNNPIYHVQTSSEKQGESSDTDTSISSVELAKFFASRGGHQHHQHQQHLKPESHASAEDLCMLPDEQHGLSSHDTKSPSCLRVLGIEDKKNNSLVPYGLAQAQNQEEAATTRIAEGNSLENSYRVNRLESNGHAQSSTIRPGGCNEQSLRQSSARRHCSEVLRPGTKNGTPPSPGIGTYRTQALVSEDDATVQHDLELRLGNSGVSSGRASPKDYRNRLSPSVSRPLFTTGNWDSSSIIAIDVRDGHRVQNRERSDAAQERPSSRNPTAVKNADEREVFTLRGWSAAFLQPTENFPKGVPVAPTVVNETATPERATTPDPPKKESQRETSNGIIRFQGRSSKGGVAWTVSEPPGSAKKLRNGGPA